MVDCQRNDSVFVSEFGGESLAQGRSAMNEEEAAAAGAQKFGSTGAGRHQAVVQSVEFGVRDARCDAAFCLPSLFEERAQAC